MKKVAYFLVTLALLLALLPAMTTAHTEEDPLVVDLLAGQTEDIGDVKVWNDADNLYVQFVYIGSDCGFLEVHLQVDEGAWDEDILTNKGNPIPGQFERSHKPGFCFDENVAFHFASLQSRCWLEIKDFAIVEKSVDSCVVHSARARAIDRSPCTLSPRVFSGIDCECLDFVALVVFG